MASTTNVLITGPNRGIGNGLLKIYLSRPNHVVIAGVRDPSVSKFLNDIPKAANTSLIIVKIDSAVETDPAAAIALLKSSHGITKLDTVIANSGIGSYFGPVSSTPVSEMNTHYQINTIGPLVLFQAVLPLLNAAPVPKFVLISTVVASMTILPHLPFDTLPYGASKIAASYLVRSVHLQHENIITFPLHPGWVQTEMGNAGAHNARAGKIEQAEITLEQSVTGIVKVVDEATREVTGGNLVNYDGSVLPW